MKWPIYTTTIFSSSKGILEGILYNTTARITVKWHRRYYSDFWLYFFHEIRFFNNICSIAQCNT